MFQKRIHRHFPPLQFQATAVRDYLRSKRVYCLVYLKHFDVHHHHSLPSTKGSSIEALVITAALHGPTCNVDAIAEDVGDASRSPLLLPLPLLPLSVLLLPVDVADELAVFSGYRSWWRAMVDLQDTSS